MKQERKKKREKWKVIYFNNDTGFRVERHRREHRGESPEPARTQPSAAQQENANMKEDYPAHHLVEKIIQNQS